MKVGIAKEIRPGERRVAATPDTTRRLVKLGFEICIESGAGAGASFPDAEFDANVDCYIAALAEQPATAMSLSKALLYRTEGMSFEASIEAGVQANAQARMTDDFKRGVERFLKKS